MTSRSDAAKRLLEWPHKKQVYLTLDFECDYGTALTANHYNAVKKSSRLVDLLAAHDVPLSCFLQTEILETCPDTLTPLREASTPIEFHAHSHTHAARSNANIDYEVEESVRRIRETFGTTPLGFRFPDGAANAEDYAVLAAHDVNFSSSLFPSWRPGRFNNARGLRVPHELTESGVVEIPFTVQSGIVRIPVSLSYLKLFGAAYEQLLAARPPSTIVFDFHMHDLVVASTYSELPLPYRAIYARRKHDGLKILDRFIHRLQHHGYTFGQMTDLYSSVTESA